MKKFILTVFFVVFFSVNIIFIADRLIQLQKIRSSISSEKESLSLLGENKESIPEMTPNNTPIPAGNNLSIPQKQTNLNIRVLGIIHGEKSVAFIELISQKSNGIFLEGDIIDGAKILEIQKDRVIFQLHDEKKALKIDNPDFQTNDEFSIKKITPFERAVDRQSLFRNVVKIAREANNLKITASKNEKKKIAGLKVTDIPQQGIIKELGLENNDIIKKVNGYDIKSIPNAIKVYKKIRKNPNIEVEVMRNNTPLVLKYQLMDFK